MIENEIKIFYLELFTWGVVVHLDVFMKVLAFWDGLEEFYVGINSSKLKYWLAKLLP